MNIFHKNTALYTILLMFFLDIMSIGLAYPIFSSMIYSTSSHILPPEASQAVRGLWLGILLALVPIGQFFSAPILGAYSDRLGRRRLMILSTALSVFGYTTALMGVWHESIILLALSRIIIGIATGNQAIGSAVITDISSPEEKAKNFGLLHMAGGLGFTVGPLLGGKLSTIHLGILSGYAVPFACAGALTMINLLLIIFLFRETHRVSTQERGIISFGLRNITRAWQIPGFALFFLAIFMYTFGWSFYWDFIPVYWITNYKFDAAGVYNMYALGALSYALSSGLLIRPLVSKFKAETVFLYALFGCALSTGLPLLFSSPCMYLMYIPLQQFFIALTFPVTATIISNKSSSQSQGEMMGILESVQSLSGIISPLSAGILLGLTVKMPLIVGTGALLFAAYILYCSLRKTN